MQKTNLDKVIKSIVPNPHHKYIYPLPARAKLLEAFFNILGYDLSEDVARIQLDDSSALLIAATAGAGKTTNINVKMALIKATMKSPNFEGLVKGDRILALVYNKHNVKQITEAQERIVDKLSCISDLNIDPYINAYTMHKFCKVWIRECISYLDLPRNAYSSDNMPLSDKEIKSMIKTISDVLLGKNHEVDIFPESIKSFYDLIRESLIPYEQMEELPSFPSLNLEKDFVIKLFTALDKLKKTKKKFDFTDSLISVEKGLREHPEMVKMITTYYDYITVDEVQDFTPVMMEIVRHLQTPEVPIICIGDDDQSIYGFKGADLFNTLDFENKFEGGTLLSLTLNRRCGEKIIDNAVKIIEHNTIRLDKDIKGNRPGGIVNIIPYSSRDGQLIKVVDTLNRLTTEEKGKTIVCYRKQISSLKIGEMLLRAGIPFNIISGYKPLSNQTYKDIRSILSLLARPANTFDTLELFKILPLKKGDYFKLVGYDEKRNEFLDYYEPSKFYERDYAGYMDKPDFVMIMSKLKYISQNINNLNLDQYLPYIVTLYKKYYWEYKKKISDAPDIEEYFLNDVVDFFNKPNTFDIIDGQFETLIKKAQINERTGRGVTLSTFHGLKGLEYDRVIIIDMDDDIFPNYKQIDDNKHLSEKQALQLKEDEVRLFYVALTRARDYLDIYYSESNPSLFISWLNKPRKKKEFVAEGTPLIKSNAFGFSNQTDFTLNLFEKEPSNDDSSELFDNLFESDDSEEVDNLDDLFEEGSVDTELEEIKKEEKKPESEIPKYMEDIDNQKESEDSNIISSFLDSVLDKF